MVLIATALRHVQAHDLPDWVYHWLVPLWVAATLAMVVVLSLHGSALRNRVATNGIVSFELAETPWRALKILRAWDDPGRRRAMWDLWIDYVFIILYAAALAAACLVATAYWGRPEFRSLSIAAVMARIGPPLAGATLVAGLFDMVENAALLLTLANFEWEGVSKFHKGNIVRPRELAQRLSRPDGERDAVSSYVMQAAPQQGRWRANKASLEGVLRQLQAAPAGPDVPAPDPLVKKLRSVLAGLLNNVLSDPNLWDGEGRRFAGYTIPLHARKLLDRLENVGNCREIAKLPREKRLRPGEFKRLNHLLLEAAYADEVERNLDVAFPFIAFVCSTAKFVLLAAGMAYLALGAAFWGSNTYARDVAGRAQRQAAATQASPHAASGPPPVAGQLTAEGTEKGGPSSTGTRRGRRRELGDPPGNGLGQFPCGYSTSIDALLLTTPVSTYLLERPCLCAEEGAIIRGGEAQGLQRGGPIPRTSGAGRETMQGVDSARNALAILAAVSIGATGGTALTYAATTAEKPEVVGITGKAPLRLLTTIRLDRADGGFNDYLIVDPPAHRLYAGYAAAGALVAIDTRTNRVVGKVGGLRGVRSIAVVPDLGTGFTSNRGEDTVGVVRLADLQLLKRIPGGHGPDAILYDRAAGVVYCGDHEGRTGTLIDPKTRAVVATVPLGGAAEYCVADPRTGLIYQNLEDTSQVAVIDPRARRVIRRFGLGEGRRPTGLAMAPDHRRLFVACANRMLIVLSLVDGRVVGTVPIGGDVDFAAYDPGLQRIYVPSGDGFITVIEQGPIDRYRVTARVPTRSKAARLAVDPSTHRVYVVASAGDHAEIMVFDAAVGRPQQP